MANKKAENEKLDKIVAKYAGQNGSLIPVLQEVQRQFGFISSENMESLARKMGIPLSQVYGVATFYTQFRFHPHGKHTLKVCHGTACYVSGAKDILDRIADEFGIEEGQTTEDKLLTLERVSCLGACGLAPIMMIDETTFGRLNPSKATKIIKKVKREGLKRSGE